MKERKYSSIRLEITSKCNINCDYCHNSEYLNKKNDMTTEEILRLVSSAKKVHPVKKILLTGGEPLMNNDIIKIIDRFSNMGIKTDMVTNGKLLNKKLIRDLEQAGLKRIRISIDGLTTHQEYRRGSNANDLWRLIQWASTETTLNTCVHTVCSPINVSELYAIYKKTIESNVDRWRVFDIGFKGRVVSQKEKLNLNGYYNLFFQKSKKIIKDLIANNPENRLDTELSGVFRSEMLTFRAEEWTKKSFNQLKSEKLLNSPCDYIKHQLTIRSSGVSTFCQYFYNEIHNFKKSKYNFSDAMLKKNKKVFENDVSLSEITHCVDCKYLLLCSSGCRSRSQVLTKKLFEADPVGCFMTSKIYTEIVPILPKETQKIFYHYLNMSGNNPFYTEIDLDNFLQEGSYLF